MPPELLSLLKSFSPILDPVWQVVKSWWWLPLPFILWQPVSFLWLWWRTDHWLAKIKYTVFEIKIPKEVLKPIRAMETVIDSIRQSTYHPPDWWEKWIDGQRQLSCSFEITSFGGEPHFYVRTPSKYKDSIESALYSQYPDAEIIEADDYAKYIPQDIPNKDWDLWATDYKLLKQDCYPIKTYSGFETERETKEEKRIDPIAGLLEAMGKIQPGEQLWVQMIFEPVTSKEDKWIKEGEKIRDELAKRIKKTGPKKPLIVEATDVIISGKVPDEIEKEKELIPPEMRLTPGERTTLEGVEKKIAKPGIKTNIRFIFLGKRDVFNKTNLRLAFGFFGSYSTENLNTLVPWGKTITKIHKTWFLPLNLIRKRRLYLRQRKIFRNYVRRMNPLFPRQGGTFILNTEELASLFHFPGRSAASAPFVSRIEAKKGEAPTGLPTE